MKPAISTSSRGARMPLEAVQHVRERRRRAEQDGAERPDRRLRPLTAANVARPPRTPRTARASTCRAAAARTGRTRPTKSTSGRTTRARDQSTRGPTRPTTATAASASAQATNAGQARSGVETRDERDAGQADELRPRIEAVHRARADRPRCPSPCSEWTLIAAHSASAAPSRRGDAVAEARTRRACRRSRPARWPAARRPRPGTRSRPPASAPGCVARPRSTNPLRRRPSRGRRATRTRTATARCRGRWPAASARIVKPRMSAPVATSGAARAATRSERPASTALTAATVITASPMPISACTPSIAAARCRAGRCRTSRARATHALAPAITASQAPTRDDGQEACRGAAAAPRAQRASAPPTTSAPITPMFSTFAPSAVTPPSANTKACVTSTTDITTQASQGPSRIAASAGAEEVAARAARDREVEHLRREHERRGDAEQRDAALVEVAARAPQAVRRRRRRPAPAQPAATSGRQEAVRDVHGGASCGADSRRRRRRSGSARSGVEAGSALDRVAHRVGGVAGERHARRRRPRRPPSRGGGRRARSRPGPWPMWTCRTRPTVLERVEVAVDRGDVAVAGDVLGAQRPSDSNSACRSRRRGARQAQAAGAHGAEGSRGGRRLHRRDEVRDSHKSSSWSIAPPAWRVQGAIAHDPQKRISAGAKNAWTWPAG